MSNLYDEPYDPYPTPPGQRAADVSARVAAEVERLQREMFGPVGPMTPDQFDAFVTQTQMPQEWDTETWDDYLRGQRLKLTVGPADQQVRGAAPPRTSLPDRLGAPGGPTAATDVEQVIANLAPGKSVVITSGGKRYIVSKDSYGKVTAEAIGSVPASGTAGYQDLGDSWLLTQPDGTTSIVNKPKSAVAPTPWGQTEAGMRAGWAAETQETQRERDFKATESNKEREFKTLADQSASDLKLKLGQLEADTSLSLADKEMEKQRIINAANKDLAEMADQFNRYKLQLEDEASRRQDAAQRYVAEGNWSLARDQMVSAERVAAAKAMVDREIAAMGMFGQLLAVESQERSRRAESAASIFSTLAQLAPQDQLRSAFYLLRGQAPPASAVTQIPPGLMAALGQNPDTVAAAAQQLRGALSAPPWMSKLLGGGA